MPQAVAGSKDVAQQIFTMLGERVGKETSGPVLGLMLQMLNMSGTDMASASEDFKKLAATEPYAILTKNWPVLCRAVLAGHEQTALAAHDGAHAMLFLYSQAGQDKARVKVVLQGMADMMWCAALAFDRALVASKDSEGAAKT